MFKASLCFFSNFSEPSFCIRLHFQLSFAKESLQYIEVRPIRQVICFVNGFPCELSSTSLIAVSIEKKTSQFKPTCQICRIYLGNSRWFLVKLWKLCNTFTYSCIVNITMLERTCCFCSENYILNSWNVIIKKCHQTTECCALKGRL